MSASDERARDREAMVARRLQWSVQVGIAGMVAVVLELLLAWLVSPRIGLLSVVVAWPLFIVVLRRRGVPR